MPPLHHIGYWVDDLDAAIDRAIETLGVGPFLVHPHVRFETFVLRDGTAIEDAGYFDHSAAFASWGPVVLELAAVHTVDPWLAEAYGLDVQLDVQAKAHNRLGHVSWTVPDLAAESAALEARGCRLIHTATAGAVAVAWHDGGALFPHPIEVHRAGAVIDGMPGRLRSLADGWDGTYPRRPMQG